VTGWILFFDGECAFCSKSVRFVAYQDRFQRISFAPLQGELAKQKGFTGYAAKDGGTMAVIRESDGQIFLRSDAWIETARAMGGFWSVLTFTKWIPKPVRDFVYWLVANNRYRFVRKSDSCQLPDAEVVKRLRS